MPKTEDEVRTQIATVTEHYRHVLDAGPATMEINAPRAIMQISAKCELDALYWVLGETRPKFTCDDQKRKNQ